jgi:hypothetical protein
LSTLSTSNIFAQRFFSAPSPPRCAWRSALRSGAVADVAAAASPSASARSRSEDAAPGRAQQRKAEVTGENVEKMMENHGVLMSI